MADIIQLLPDTVANQIAAGEVIQRPASVVKELMENAIDAKAKSIKVYVKEAGKTLIQIFDDGVGMSETDARISFERHATSKIRKADDMLTLRTMGFRGEALSSVAAVAQVELKTRTEHNELGTHLVVADSRVESQKQIACACGTSMTVKNLFFNVPVRRNFLKSNHVELKHIVEEFQRIALAYSDKSFSLYHNDEEIHVLTSEPLKNRIISLFGKSFSGELVSCDEDMETLKVVGYLGSPKLSKKTRGGQYLYVNERYIKSNYLDHAVTSVFEGLVVQKSYPFYVLFITTDPKHIDVNVHPTKTEIKFDDTRQIYAVMRSAAKRALESHNLVPTIDFDQDVNVIEKLKKSSEREQSVYFDEYNFPKSAKDELDDWQQLYNTSLTPSTDNSQHSAGRLFNEKTGQSHVNQDNEFVSTSQPILQLYNTYLVKVVKDGLMLIDQQAAHERMLYERYINRSSGESQHSLFPQTIELSSADYALVMEIREEITALGFYFEPFGASTILVSGVPPDMSGTEQDLFEDLIEQFKDNRSQLSLPTQENLAWSLARRLATKKGQPLNQEGIDAIVEGLFSCQTPRFAFKGTPTFFILNKNKIAQYFQS